MIKRYGAYVIVSIVLLALLWSGYEACNIHDGYSELKGKYDALLIIAAKRKSDAEIIITAQNDYIKQLSETIKGALKVIGDKNSELESKDADIIEVTEAYNLLESDTERVDNLLSQVNLWKEKFTLAEVIIAEQDSVIFSLNEKYNAQLKITVEYQDLYVNEQQLHALCIQRLGIAEKKLSGQKFISSVKSIIVLGLGGVIAVQVIK